MIDNTLHNVIELNYAVIIYDKSRSKIQIVCDIAEELQVAPNISYLLCDSWYTCDVVMDAFLKKSFYTIGALKTNRVIYPMEIKQKISEFALYMRSSDKDVHLVTVASVNTTSNATRADYTALKTLLCLSAIPREPSAIQRHSVLSSARMFRWKQKKSWHVMSKDGR